MQRVFLKYEEGTLKGQKKKEMKGITLQKALEGRYAAKLTQFKIFQGLKVRFSTVFLSLRSLVDFECRMSRRFTF